MDLFYTLRGQVSQAAAPLSPVGLHLLGFFVLTGRDDDERPRCLRVASPPRNGAVYWISRRVFRRFNDDRGFRIRSPVTPRVRRLMLAGREPLRDNISFQTFDFDAGLRPGKPLVTLIARSR
jgi:hypothetical protein